MRGAESSPSKPEITGKPEFKANEMEAIPEVKAKPRGYSNPAFRAMGINRIWIPSRNWMIFFAVTGVFVGGAIYDRREQKKIREKWMKLAEPYGQKILEVDEVPRKLSIFMSPPPDEYLEKSYNVFKKFVKPVFNAGGVDTEIFYSKQQGMIRHHVASRIRYIRRNVESLEKEIFERKNKQIIQKEQIYWSDKVKAWFSKSAAEKISEIEEKNKTEEFVKKMANQKALLGLYVGQGSNEISTHSEDEATEDVHKVGGVVCIGRGSYKEYLLGVHEGLLGPLTKPERVIEAQAENQYQVLSDIRDRKMRQKKKDEPDLPEVKNFEELEAEIRARGEKDDGKANPMDLGEEYADDQFIEPDIVRSYLLPNEFLEKGVFAPEFVKYYKEDRIEKIPSKDGVAPFFQQSISVMEVPYLIGFLNIPRRIWRFYNRRYLADMYGELAMEVLKNEPRKFIVSQDENLGAREEEDWPAKWVQKSKDAQRDWVEDLIGDPRVTKYLSVYNKETVSKEE